MKASPKKLLPLTVIGIAVTSLSFVRPAQAYTVTMKEVGSDVVSNGSGPINLTGLTFKFLQTTPPRDISPSLALITTGPTSPFLPADVYTGFSGPASFGSRGATSPNTGSGDLVGIYDFFGYLYVPHGYVSGHPLMDTMTFNNATFASLNVTPGTYTWTWGTGPNQKFTLQIGPARVPDGGSTVSLLGFALLGLAALRRKLSC
jgi:hypothetical protein